MACRPRIRFWTEWRRSQYIAATDSCHQVLGVHHAVWLRYRAARRGIADARILFRNRKIHGSPRERSSTDCRTSLTLDACLCNCAEHTSTHDEEQTPEDCQHACTVQAAATGSTAMVFSRAAEPPQTKCSSNYNTPNETAHVSCSDR